MKIVVKNFTCVTSRFAMLLILENVSTAQVSSRVSLLKSLSSLQFCSMLLQHQMCFLLI